MALIPLHSSCNRAPRKIASGMALASIHSGCRSGSPWPAHSEPVFFEVPTIEIFNQPVCVPTKWGY